MDKRGDPLIGKRVREARDRLGVTQQILADAIGVERGTVAGIETAHRPPGREMLLNMGDFFQVPVDYFTSRDDLMASALWVLGRLPKDELEAWVKVMLGRATGEKIKPRD